MPGMVREFRQVKLAFAVRGLHVHALSLKPIFTMLVNSVRWSECVAMAMESKGFCGHAPRSYYFVPRVHGYDIAAAVAAVGGILLGIACLHY